MYLYILDGIEIRLPDRGKSSVYLTFLMKSADYGGRVRESFGIGALESSGRETYKGVCARYFSSRKDVKVIQLRS